MKDLTDFNSMSLGDAALGYLKMGWSLIPLAPGTKSAHISKDWNSDKFRLCGGENHWNVYPKDNIGCHLGRSRLVTVDIDNIDGFKTCMGAIEKQLLSDAMLDVPFWNVHTAGIRSGREGSGKRVFLAPDDMILKPKRLNWVVDGKSTCIFELRAGGQQDALPPSLHPNGRNYQWIKHPDAEVCEILPMPDDLVYLWLFWNKYQPAMETSNPDYVAPKITEKMKKSGVKYEGTNYIEMWKNQQNLEAMLETYGYLKKGRSRMLSPDSHTGNPGIVLYNGGTTFFSFGQSDKFADGHSHDAYDLLVECEHHGDRRAAWEEILDYFGVDMKAEKAKFALAKYNADLRRKLASMPRNPLEVKVCYD